MVARRLALLAGIAALALLAGCNGTGDDPTPTREPYDVGPRTTAPEATVPTDRPAKSGTAVPDLVGDPVAVGGGGQGGSTDGSAGRGSDAGSGEGVRAPGRTVFDDRTFAARVAPGLTLEGVDDPAALAEGYAAAVADRPLRARVASVVRAPNGTVLARVRTDVWLSGDHTRFYRETSVTGGRLPSGVYNAVHSDGRNVLGVIGPDGRYYDVNPSSAGQPNVRVYLGGFVTGSHLEGYLAAVGRASVRRANATGSADGDGGAGDRYVLRGESFDRPAALPDRPIGATPRNLTSLRVVVDDRGFVHRVRLTYAVEFRGRPATVTRVERYALGPVSVPTPDWVRRARRSVEGSTANGTAIPWSPRDG